PAAPLGRHRLLDTGLRRPAPRPARGAGQRQRRAAAADVAGIPPAALSDDAPGPCDQPDGAGRAPLRPGLRPRLQHHRGVRRPAAQEDRRRPHRDGARPGLPPDPAARGERRGVTDGAGGSVETETPASPRSWGRWFGRPGRSLTRRLIWLASAWIVLALVLTGWTLTNQYEESSLRRLGNVLSDTIDE